MERSNSLAFTLIELLVVVTIIVVLLALLVPAMDRAIYQAELAVCGTRLKAIASGVQSYALSFNRSYPYRETQHGPSGRPVDLRFGLGSVEEGTGIEGVSDDRPPLRGYVPMVMLLCPLTGEIDLETNHPDSRLYSTYNLWFDWQWTAQPGMKRMRRLGDRFTYYGGKSYGLLASDWDGYYSDRPQVISTHPDRDDVVIDLVLQDQGGAGTDGVSTSERSTFSFWHSPLGTNRGLIDLNFAYDDGGVQRLADVKPQRSNIDHDDPRMDQVQQYNDGSNPTWVTSMPRQ